MISAFATGGYPYAPSLELLIVVPIFIFLISDRISGTVWSIIVFISYILCVVLSHYGFDFPVIFSQPKGQEFFLKLYIWLLMFFIIIGTLFVYDSIARHFKNELRHMATHDELTGLPNRNLLNDRLNRAAIRSIRYQQSFALIYLDLDRFKPINDKLGHSTGDQVLQCIADRLKRCLRGSDTISRVGGDEFVFIIENISTIENVEIILHKIYQQLSTPIEIDNKQLVLGGSFGISIFPNDTKDIEELQSYADSSMYHAKKKENTYCFHQTQILKKIELGAELPRTETQGRRG